MVVINTPVLDYDYKVNTAVYEGPLDLLLQLIERAELDITKLSLAQVTDQYIYYLEKMPDQSADKVSEFLVIAAKLLQIKSEALLPRAPVRLPGEEDPGEALARQLVSYRRYKQIAEILGVRQQEHLQTYCRTAPHSEIETRFELSGVFLQDLIDAAIGVHNNRPLPQAPLSNIITPPKITIRQKIRSISLLLNLHKKLDFNFWVKDSTSRLEIVVSFLAVLELVRLHVVKVSQGDVFSEITIEADEDWQGGEDLELEFGE